MEEGIIAFVVTKACQLQCKYCYLVGKNQEGKMSFDVAQKAIDYILNERKFLSTPSVTFDFIGGEPLLEIKLLEDITSYIIASMQKLSHPWKDNFHLKITTNGLLYRDKRVQRYISRYKEILRLSISFDGIKAKHDLNRVFPNGQGSYNKVLIAIPLWKEQFPNEGTRMVVSHDDLRFIKDSAVHLIQLGITIFDINTVLENVWEQGDDAIYEKQLIGLADYIIDNNLEEDVRISSFDDKIGMPVPKEQILSPCGKMLMAIDSKGDCYPCMRFMDYSLRDKEARPIGNIYEGINWNKLRPYKIIENLAYSSPKCLECEIANGCKSCLAENYDSSLSASIYQRSVVACLMHQARVRAKNYYWNKLSRKQN